MTDRDLSALTARSNGLRGALHAPRRPSVAPVSSQPAETTSAEETQKPTTPRSGSTSNPADTAPGSVPAPTSEPPEAKQSKIVYLPGPLLADLRAALRSTEDTYTDWILDTFDETYDRLSEVYPPPAARQSPLPARRRPQRRRIDTPTALQLRLNASELATLDQRQAELGIPSRSELITTIVELGLGKKPTSSRAAL